MRISVEYLECMNFIYDVVQDLTGHDARSSRTSLITYILEILMGHVGYFQLDVLQMNLRRLLQ